MSIVGLFRTYFKILISLVLFSILISQNCLAQVPPISEEAARKELDRRGISEEEMRDKLLEMGIDIDDVDPTNPRQIIELESALDEAVRAIEKEKQQEKANEAAQEKQEIERLANEAAQDTIRNRQDDAIKDGFKDAAKTSADDISKAVKDGATIEEAVAEELIDNDEEELPEAKVYGQQIFRNKSIRLYRQSENIKPPDTYILGAGDKIAISIWGKSQENAEYVISKEGYIKPSQMPRIYLKGINLGKARALLRSRYSEYYKFREEEFEVMVNYARTITVNIVGEVFNYGSFTMPAINTAFNALVASGGPSDIGSVRNIKLIRPGEQTRKIDIYEFLLDPSVAQNLYLQDNDIIHVEVADRLVSINGAIKRPFKYELVKGENLLKLIEYAGGLKENAYKGIIQIRRFENDEQVIVDVNLNDLIKSGKDFEILSGDEVIIKNIPKPYKNYAEISGAVEIPGKYEITSGMKLRELIDKGVLSDDARTDIAFLLRTKPDNSIAYERVRIEEILSSPSSPYNFTLKPKDRLMVLSLVTFSDRDSISVSGAVRIPRKIQYDEDQNMKVSDALILSGGLAKDATNFAYIYRTDDSNIKQKEYIRVDLEEISKSPGSVEDYTLQPSDSLIVFSTLTYLDESTVRVIGAVRKPGKYKYDESLKLKDVLTMAGGLKLEATSNRIDVFRVIIENDQPTKTAVATLSINEDLNVEEGNTDFELKPYDQIVVREVPEFEFQRIIVLKGEVRYPGPYALISKNEKLWSVIERAGGLTDEAFTGGATLYREEDGIGWVVMGLSDVSKNKNSRFNYIMKEGDVVEIPKQKDLVTITGATKAIELYPKKILRGSKINVAHHRGKSAKFYIDKYAAGIGEGGRRRLVTVEHPNGEIERTRNYGIFKKYPEVRPGSIITVGRKKVKPEKDKKKNEDIDWGRTIADSIAQATAILSLILLVQQVNK